jgi:hypothetical protein
MINGNINIKGIRINNGFAGTITQGSGFTMTIGTSGWVQYAGNFTGGNSAMTIGSGARLLGGSFATTSGLLTVQGATYQVSPASLNVNMGTVTLKGSLFNDDPLVFNHLNLDFWGGFNYSISNSLTVNGTLAAYTNGCGNGTANFTSGTVLALGPVTNSGGCSGIQGAGKIIVGGNGDQSVTGDGGYFPNFEIASSGGTVTLGGTLHFRSNFKYTSGSLATTGSTVIFSANYLASSVLTFDNVTIRHVANTYSFDNELMVSGTLTFDNGTCGGGNSTLNGGSLKALGNVAITGGCGTPNGSTVIKMGGSVSQTISTTSTYRVNLPVQINSTGGTVSFAGAADLRNGLTVNTGAAQLQGASDSLKVNALALNGNTLTRNGGSVTVNSVLVPAGAQSLYGGIIDP